VLGLPPGEARLRYGGNARPDTQTRGVGGQYDELWADLDNRLRIIVSSLGVALSSRDATLIVDLLDHNEFGVAFEMLRDQLIEYQRPIPEPTVDALVKSLA
jgi:hypothetical protein